MNERLTARELRNDDVTVMALRESGPCTAAQLARFMKDPTIPVRLYPCWAGGSDYQRVLRSLNRLAKQGHVERRAGEVMDTALLWAVIVEPPDLSDFEQVLA